MKLLHSVCLIASLICSGYSLQSNYKEALLQTIMNNPEYKETILKEFANTYGKFYLYGDTNMHLSSLQDIFKDIGKSSGVVSNFNVTIEDFVKLFCYTLRSSTPADIFEELYEKLRSRLRLSSILPPFKDVKRLLGVADLLDDDDPSLVVTTRQGRVQGVKVEKNEFKYISFYSIPFASVPTRFQPPGPPSSWTGIRKMKVEGKNICLQKLTYMVPIIVGSEDCLHLTVQVSSLEKKQPVFVYIYGGIFKFGTGETTITNPYKLVKEGMVVVMLNYRVGPFGFLSTNTRDAPGNNGLKDVVAGLKWIQENIREFGGDPESVTVFGMSSAGAVVDYLVLSPMAKGLFTKVIISSGAATADWALKDNAVFEAYQLGRTLGSNATNSEDLITFLKKVDAVTLFNVFEKMNADSTIIRPSQELMYAPNIENGIPEDEKFLPNHPYTILKSGKYNKVPTMVTFVTDESLIFLRPLNKNFFAQFNNNDFELLVPKFSSNGLESHADKLKIAKKIKEFYFNGSEASLDNLQGLADFLSDSHYIYPLHRTINGRLKTSNMPIYYMEFAYDGMLGSSKLAYSNITGVSHADNLAYMLSYPGHEVFSQIDKKADIVSKRLVKMTANFAKYGDPTPSKTKLLPVRWTPIRNVKTHDYLYLSDELEMKQNPNKERMDFWDKLLEYKKHLLAIQNRSP